MKLCPACRRHLRAPEVLCPFCGAEQRSEADRSGPSRVMGAVIGALLVACGEGPMSSGADSSSSSGGGGSSGASTTTGPNTGAPTTGGPSPMTDTDSGTTPGPTTDGSSSTTSPGLDTGDEGCAFYAGCPPDVGREHVIACDVVSQDCAAGQKCVGWGTQSWTGAKCVPVGGDQQPGEACKIVDGQFSGLDDCEAGSRCWSSTDSDEGICVPQCTGEPGMPTCPADSGCAAFSDTLLLCLPNCDPLILDCPESEVCVATEGEFVCVLDVSGMTGAVNDPCDFVNGCDPGLACVELEAASSECAEGGFGCCQPYCDTTMPTDCPNPDQACVPWFDPMEDEIPPGLEDVGVCSIAP